jgi:hypothetical protein
MQHWGLLCPYCDGDDRAAKLRPGNVHLANGTFDLIKPIIIGYCKKFKLFWLREKRIRAMKRLYFKYAKLCLYILTILDLVFFCLNSGEAQDAMPGATTLVSPSGTITDITPAYTWNAESNSTWYYLWVNDSTGNRITQWYTADQAGCAGGTGQCSVTPSIELAEGNGTWWIQTWNYNGYGPWSDAKNFSLECAQLGMPVLDSPSGIIRASTPTYTWQAEEGATWYFLWVNGPSGNIIQQWYETLDVCSGDTCIAKPEISLAEGNHTWWVQAWSDCDGYGPWSAGMDLVLDPLLPTDNGCLIIGDSIGEATHTNDACDRTLGDHRELMECIDLRLGSHDLDWSFMGGTKSWSIANRLECSSVYNRSHDGDEWKDALDRAWNQIQPKEVGNVILQLGSNDVCAEYGHDYGSLAFVQSTIPDNIVSIEAEHFIQRISSITHQWEPDRIAGASILAVRAQPDSGTSMPYPDYLTSSPRLDYRVNFVRTGIHYVWLRGYANGTDDYLIHVGLDGQRQSTAENIKIENYNEWIWSGITENGTYAMINVPSTGIHTLNVYMHQDGFRLDKIVLITNNLWAPLNEGPSESARGIIKQVDQSGDVLVTIEAEHYHYLQKVETYS